MYSVYADNQKLDIKLNINKLYIDCANGDTYEYDGTELTKCKKKIYLS